MTAAAARAFVSGTAPADVRGEQQAGRRPQRVPLGQRLGVGDVERRPQPAGGQLGQQRVGVDDDAAGGVDQQGAVLHRGEERRRRPSRASPAVTGTMRTTTSACGSSSRQLGGDRTPSRAVRAT